MNKLWGLLIALFLASCANIVAPSGGEKDEVPPVFAKSTPENYSVEFKGGVIRIDFDEYIRLQQTQNILISPQLEVKPEIEERYRSVYIDLKGQKLSENTTYTINFASSITDLNEGNKLTNFRFVFSTGSFLDSLKQRGLVVDAETGEAVEDVLVGLYPDHLGDSTLYKSKPFYFARTNKQGEFSLENLKYGTFKLYAFKDEDNNYLYKSTEQIAYIDTLLKTDTVSKALKLRLFKDPEAERKPKEVRGILPGIIRLKYANPVDTALRVNLLNSNRQTASLVAADSIYFFHLDTESDSLTLGLYLANHSDTIKVINRKPGERGYPAFNIQRDMQSTPSIYEPLVIKANQPIVQVDTAGFTWKKDTTEVDLAYTTEIKGQKLSINAQFEPNATYELFIDSGSIIGFFGGKNDTLRLNLNSGNAELFGTLILLDLDSLKQGSLIQLLDENGKIVRQQKYAGEEAIKFDKLRAIGYKLRVITDVNGNNRWDTGSYILRQQPEYIQQYPELIRLRSNWELEISLYLLSK
jgi:hypothetical protein